VGFVADDAGLAGAHSAGHGLFEGDLARDVEGGGDAGGGFHHGGGAAAVDDEVAEVAVGFLAGVEEFAEGVGDVAFHAEGAIIGGDDGGEVHVGEFFDVEEGGAVGVGGAHVGREGEGEEIVTLGADEGGGAVGHLLGEGVGEVEHGGDADASADEAGVFEGVRDVEALAEGAEDGDLLPGAELGELEGALADDAVENVEFDVAIDPEAVAGDGEGAAEVGEGGVEVGVVGEGERGVGFFAGPGEDVGAGVVVGEHVGVGAVELYELAGGTAGEAVQAKDEEVMVGAEAAVFLDGGDVGAACAGGGGGGDGRWGRERSGHEDSTNWEVWSVPKAGCGGEIFNNSVRKLKKNESENNNYYGRNWAYFSGVQPRNFVENEVPSRSLKRDVILIIDRE
jgi:hypothetical protein